MASTTPHYSPEQQPLLVPISNRLELIQNIQVEIKCHQRRAKQIVGDFAFPRLVNGAQLEEIGILTKRVEALRRQEKVLRNSL